MPRITAQNWRILVKVFEKYGCAYKRKQGSHHVLTYPGAKRAIIIPEYDEVDIEIIKNNMRTVNMSREKYFELLKKCQ
jgi:predicted RNA binding protein YcfA (HicA-like mRNA interferase family)